MSHTVGLVLHFFLPFPPPGQGTEFKGSILHIAHPPPLPQAGHGTEWQVRRWLFSPPPLPLHLAIVLSLMLSIDFRFANIECLSLGWCGNWCIHCVECRFAELEYFAVGGVVTGVFTVLSALQLCRTRTPCWWWCGDWCIHCAECSCADCRFAELEHLVGGGVVTDVFTMLSAGLQSWNTLLLVV